MLQSIREIGIFMIVAQAVVHFAPGKQYEKYIKSISGVIILVLFLKPFVQMAGGQWQTPSAFQERLKEAGKLAENFSDVTAMSDGAVETAVIGHMEEEIMRRLNRELAADSFSVKRVELILEENPEGGDAIYAVRILMGDRAADSGGIAVEEITVSASQAEEEKAVESYRVRFAGLLGLKPERVEVRRDGRD